MGRFKTVQTRLFDAYFDIAFLLKWYRLEADSAALFVFLVVFHLSFLIAAFVFLHQRDTGRYIDPVDIRDGRKVRVSITGGIGLLVIMGFIAAFSIMTANSMTDYIYKSRNGHYDTTIDDPNMKASMSVTSFSAGS